MIPNSTTFRIIQKPDNFDMLASRKGERSRKIFDLFEMLKVLASDKTIQTTIKEMHFKNLLSLKASIYAWGRKKNMEIGVIEKDGVVFIFNR